MKLIILTQDDPFYLGKNIDYLLNNIAQNDQVVATVLFDVSPFGKRENFTQKMKKTLDVFGIKFFVYYSLKFIKSKFSARNSVAKVLKKHNVPLLKLPGNINSKQNLEILKNLEPDLLISIGGNQIFKRPLLELATKGCINLHTALLPKYRGLMPSFWVLKNNETYTGVSVFLVDEGIDTGPILVQKKVEIGNRSQEELIIHTKKIGMNAILEAVDLINKNNYTLIENNDDEATYFSFPNHSDVKQFYANDKRFY